MGFKDVAAKMNGKKRYVAGGFGAAATGALYYLPSLRGVRDKITELKNKFRNWIPF